MDAPIERLENLSFRAALGLVHASFQISTLWTLFQSFCALISLTFYNNKTLRKCPSVIYRDYNHNGAACRLKGLNTYMHTFKLYLNTERTISTRILYDNSKINKDAIHSMC